MELIPSLIDGEEAVNLNQAIEEPWFFRLPASYQMIRAVNRLVYCIALDSSSLVMSRELFTESNLRNRRFVARKSTV